MPSYASSLRVLSFAALSSVTACSGEDPERPPLANTGSSAGPIGNGSQGGGSEDSDSDPTAEVVSGRVYSIETDNLFLDTGNSYTTASTIHVFDVDLRGSETFDYDGTSFEATGIETRAGTWLAAQPINDSNLLPTITQQDTRLSGLGLPVLQRSVLNEILSSLVTPATFGTAAAALVVRLVDAEGLPISKARPQVVGGTDLVFRDSGFWNDGVDETSEDGIFLCYNIPSSSLPGQTVKLLLSGSIADEFTLPIAAGAVTIVTLETGP